MVKTRYDSLGVAYFGKNNAGVGYYKASTGTTVPSLYYSHSDHLGSASLITDGAGHLNQHLSYIPNGEVFVNQRVTSFDSRFKFTGKEMDEETGLYYSIQRYLDPKNVGFLSSDPLKEKFPNVSSYVYCHANPVRRSVWFNKRSSAKRPASSELKGKLRFPHAIDHKLKSCSSLRK